jgi:hypothetical protein
LTAKKSGQGEIDMSAQAMEKILGELGWLCIQKVEISTYNFG